MFEYALVAGHGRTARPYTFMVSVAGQFGLIGLSVLLPLLFVDTLPQARWIVHLVAPTAPAGPIVSDPPPETRAPARTSTQRFGEASLFEPRKFPDHAATVIDPELPPPDLASSIISGVPTGIGDPRDALIPVFTDFRALIPAPPAPVKVSPVVQPASSVPPLLKVGGKVGAPVPLHTPLPQYPPLARQARISGIVTLEAIIATDGTIRSLRVVQGHYMLVAAALAAVREWHYSPPTLNGEPIEILLRVDVKFNLNR